MKKYLITLMTCVVLFAGSTGLASNDAATGQKLTSAINDDSRPAEHLAQDETRHPLETLEFFGFRDDMKVLDILPGGGYYIRIMAPALREKGELYLTIGADYLANSLLQEEGYQHVKVVSKETSIGKPEGARYYALGELQLGLRDLDLVTSFRAYHLFDEADRQALNRAVHGVLKQGGIYAVIDHTRRHAEPETEENIRRFDPVKAIKEIQDAGFEFVDYTPMHHQSTDKLTLEVGHEDVTGRTDRWALKFVKR